MSTQSDVLQLAERLIGASYSLPADERGWYEDEKFGYVPHNVCTDAIAELQKLYQMDADKTEVIAALSRNCDVLLNAHAEIVRVHANDDVRPKAFYISAAALKELEGKE